MTENEARMLMHRSPSATTYKLVLHCGLPKAREFAEKWIKVIANLKRIPVLCLEFWCDVAMRLKGHRPLHGCCLTGLSEFERTHFDLMLSRVGMKGSHVADNDRRAVGAPIPRKCLSLERVQT